MPKGKSPQLVSAKPLTFWTGLKVSGRLLRFAFYMWQKGIQHKLTSALKPQNQDQMPELLETCFSHTALLVAAKRFWAWWRSFDLLYQSDESLCHTLGIIGARALLSFLGISFTSQTPQALARLEVSKGGKHSHDSDADTMTDWNWCLLYMGFMRGWGHTSKVKSEKSDSLLSKFKTF